MISLVVTADTKNYDPVERDKAFEKMLAQFKQPFEIVYVANADYGNLDKLREIAKKETARQLIVTAASTNINTQIYTALGNTEDGEVLLATMDTNIELLTEMISRYMDGTDLVFAKRKENWFKNMFVAIGQGTYHMGLKLLGRGRDLCCEPRIVLLNNRSVNTIILNPALSKALRLVNPDPERPAKVLARNRVYDNPSKEQKRANIPFMTLGIVSTFYIIALFIMAIVFPISNSGVYTVWIFIALLSWVVLGIIGSVISAKIIYDTRLGLPVAINLSGEPIINIEEQYKDKKQIVLGEKKKTTKVAKAENSKAVEKDKTSKKAEKEEITTTEETEENNENNETEEDLTENQIEEETSKEDIILDNETEENQIEQEQTEAVKEETTKDQEISNEKQEEKPKKKSTTKSTAKKKTTTKTGTTKPAISKIKNTKSSKIKK